MLVLTRRSGESIVIGTDIVVTVLEVRNDQVRIGIQAPRSVQVHREEVFQQISRENAAAAASAERTKAVLRRVPPGALPRGQTPRGAPRPPAAGQLPPRRPPGTAQAPPSGRQAPPSGQAPPSNAAGETTGEDQPPGA